MLIELLGRIRGIVGSSSDGCSIWHGSMPARSVADVERVNRSARQQVRSVGSIDDPP
jgi:hypothetical protein